VRTTLNLDDEVLKEVRSYAGQRCLPMGKAVSELVRKGLNSRIPIKIVDGLAMFDLPPDSPPVTSERVKELELEVD
jgi:hypothetical protein